MFNVKSAFTAAALALLTVFTVPAVSAGTETGLAPVSVEKPCVPPVLEKWMNEQKEAGHLHAVYEGTMMKALYLLTFASVPKTEYTEIKVFMEDRFPNVIYIGLRDGCYVNHTNKVPKKQYLAIVAKMKDNVKKGERGA